VGQKSGDPVAREVHLETRVVQLELDIARLQALALEAGGPLGRVIANLGFALQKLDALGNELEPRRGQRGDTTSKRLAHLHTTLVEVTQALRETRQGAERIGQLLRLVGGRIEARDDGNSASGSRELASGSAERSRVLVIDDEPMMVRAILRLLEGDHEVFATTDPVDAVAQLRQGLRFDAILCDLMMPAMSGMDVYDAIHKIEPDQARRVVFMTGGAFTPEVLAFLESVENARIEKPLERSTLRNLVGSQVRSRRFTT
jgi:CheY-like chemotaxis protein/uncharacterized coiled-coil protein SlyX